MNINNINYDAVYVIKAKHGRDTEGIVEFLKSNGSSFGFWLEKLIANHTKMITQGGGKKRPDIVTTDMAHKFECRALTKRGVQFAPSMCQGASRTYDKVKDEEHKAELTGYIIAKQENYPEVEFRFIPIGQVRDFGKSMANKKANTKFFDKSITRIKI